MEEKITEKLKKAIDKVELTIDYSEAPKTVAQEYDDEKEEK